MEITKTEDGGFERNHALRLTLAGLDQTTRAVLEAAGVDPQMVEETLRTQLNRDIPLGVTQGLTVQRVRTRTFVTDQPFAE